MGPGPSPQDRSNAAGRTETQLRLLVQTGLKLATERSLEGIVQATLDAGLEISGAAYGAFFYQQRGADGESYPLVKSCCLDTVALAAGSGPLEAMLNGPPGPFAQCFAKDQRAHAYLGVPVRSLSGEVIGGLFYGHPNAEHFVAETEELLQTLAAQAAVGLEKAQLADTLAREIVVADAARAAQRETSERLAQVLESTSDGVALLDRNWRFTYINRYANQMVAPGRELVGVGFWELFPQDVGSVFHQRYMEAMEHGRAVEFTERYEPLNMWAYVRVFPTPEGIAIFFQDVTRQKTDEKTMAETSRRFAQALEAGQLGTWTWDRATDLLDYDERAAQLWGVAAHTPISRTALREQRVFGEDLTQTPETLRETLENSGSYSAEYRIRGAEGETRWIASNGIATRDEVSGKLIGMSGTFQDITARKLQEATLRQSEKLAATGRLAATIAHEINNPLEAVTNLIYLCKTDPTVPMPIQRLLETADGELARVAQIAQQTLGFYRDTTRPTEIDIAALLTGVVDLFSRKLLSKKLVCTVDVARDLRIIGLQGEIKQVFSNLLVNAIDASSANSTIRIRGKNAARDGVPGVSVLMSDQGSGIPLHVRDRLFSPFFTTKQSVGTGLGLWVTRGIVEKQGGCIKFRTCTDLPSGTVFRVFLPAELADVEAFGPPKTVFLQ